MFLSSIMLNNRNHFAVHLRGRPPFLGSTVHSAIRKYRRMVVPPGNSAECTTAGKQGKCRRVLPPPSNVNLTDDKCPRPRVAPSAFAKLFPDKGEPPGDSSPSPSLRRS